MEQAMNHAPFLRSERESLNRENKDGIMTLFRASNGRMAILP